MRILKEFLKAVVGNVFATIPLSAILAGLVIFVTNVLYQYNYRFLAIWRTVYIWWLGLSILLALLAALYGVWRCAETARRIKRPFSDVEEAIFVYKLHKKYPISGWTDKWFDTAFTSSKIGRLMGELYVEHVLRKN